MKGLEHFTALIQLISAVNFAYIVPYFHKKVYKNLFNENQFYSDKIIRFQNMMVVELTSLNGLKQSCEEDAKKRKKVEELIERYKKLNEKWEVKKGDIEGMVDWVMNRKGFKSLFLFTSLFCVVDLLNIALSNAYNKNIFIVFTYLITILVSIYVLKLTLKILLSGWKEMDDAFCYKRTIKYFVIVFSVSIILSILNWLILKYTSFSFPINNKVTSTVVFLSVAIPLYPCVFTFLFIVLSIKFICAFTELFTITIRKEQDQLSVEKKNLEKDMKFIESVKWDN